MHKIEEEKKGACKTSRLNSEGLVAHVPSSSEQHSCRDSRSLGSITRLPGLMHFLAQHIQGHVATQSHLCQLPLQEERDFATRPIQPDDVQRIFVHSVFPRATGRTHFRLPTKLRLHSPTLDSLGSPFSIRSPGQEHDIHLLRLLPSSEIKCKAISAHSLEDISRDEGSTDVSTEEGAENLITSASSSAPSESERKRARHAAHTSLAHSTPWMLCLNTHNPSDPSWAKRPPRSVSATNFGGSQQQPSDNAPSTKHSGHDLLARMFNTFQCFIQRHDRIFVALPKVLIVSCFSPGCRDFAFSIPFL